MPEEMSWFDAFLLGFETKKQEKIAGLRVRQYDAQHAVESAQDRLETLRREEEKKYRQYESEMRVFGLTAERALFEAEIKLVAAKCAVPRAEIEARKTLMLAALENVKIEHEGHFLRHVYSLPADEAAVFIDAERGREEALLKREMVRQSRLLPPEIPSSSPVHVLPAFTPSDVNTEHEKKEASHSSDLPTLTDSQIQQLARRAVQRFSQLPKPKQEEAYAEWKNELHRRYAPLIADEIMVTAMSIKREK
jgi:hypothetical protein